MNFILVSDFHLMIDNPVCRLDDLSSAQKLKMDFILNQCLKYKAHLIFAGDLFDNARSWYVAWNYITLFNKYHLTDHKIKIFSVYGQHEMYMYSDKTKHATTLGLMGASTKIELLSDKPKVLNKLHDNKIKIYGCNYGQEVPVPYDDGSFKILVIHRMIVPNKLWATQDKYDYAPTFLNRHKGYNVILCGDCHRYFNYEHKGRVILNTGCISRHEASEYNLTYEPICFLLKVKNSKKFEVEEIDIPHKPAEEVISKVHIEKQKEITTMLDEFMEELDSKELETNEEEFKLKSNLIDYCKSNNIEQGVKDVLAETMDEEIKWR